MDEAPDLSFLHRFPVGQGRLILTAPNGSRHVFQHLNMNIIRTNCPLLALSFESSANRVPTADLEVPSIAAGICVIRYIYTKNFGWPGSECDVSMLLTAHVTMLAKLLDQWALYMAANSSLLAKIDFAASFPSPPHDIWATVRFLWTTSVAASNIKESMLNYCVAAFQHHSLGTNPEFLKLCQELIDFHMDLSRVNAQRDYGKNSPMINGPINSNTAHRRTRYLPSSRPQSQTSFTCRGGLVCRLRILWHHW